MKWFGTLKRILNGWLEENPSTLPLVAEQLHLYAARSLRFLLIVTTALVVLLLGRVPGTILAAWYLPLSLLILSRLYDLTIHQEVLDPRTEIEPLRNWVRRFRNKALLTALMVGIAVPLFHPYLDPVYLRFLLFFFVIGTSAGALAALFPSERLVTLYIVLLNLPLFLFLLFNEKPYTLAAALILVFYIIVLLVTGQTSRRFMFRVWEQQKKLRAKERELHALFEQTPTPIFYFDTDLKIRKYNQAFQTFFKLPPDLSLDRFDLRKLQDARAVKLMQQVLRTRQPILYDGNYLSTFNPDEYWLQAQIAPLFNEEGELIGGIVSFQDKTAEKRSIDHLEQLAGHDLLTGLGNRRSFYRTLDRLVRENEEEKLSLLFFLDLDRFKPINDTLGHQTGDQVLQEVAHLLKETAPQAEIFRHGGDEFIILDPHCCQSTEDAKARGEAFVSTLENLLRTRIIIDGYHLPMNGSVGIVIITPQMRDSDEIIRRADISMYQAKNSKSSFAFYDRQMDVIRQKSFYLHQGLRRDEIDSQLRLEYQPIVTLEQGRIVGAEALVRWEHPTLGLLRPDEFIPLAVENGEIGRVGQWVAREVCRTLAEIRREFPDSSLKYLAFNLDARELHYNDFAGYLENLLKQYEIRPGELVLELTENTLIDNFDQIREILTRLHQNGICWAIDDFGTGYSSLSYLERLSFDILKIDRSFTRTLEHNDDSLFLVQHVLEIAKHLGYLVTIEGIENEKQIARLQSIGSALQAQGFHYHRPLKKEAFFRLLATSETPPPR